MFDHRRILLRRCCSRYMCYLVEGEGGVGLGGERVQMSRSLNGKHVKVSKVSRRVYCHRMMSLPKDDVVACADKSSNVLMELILLKRANLFDGL